MVTLADGSHTVFNHLLHFEASPATSVIGVWQDLEDILPARVIPFAGDPGGNFLCFAAVRYWRQFGRFFRISTPSSAGI
jgi:hypothetical protein